MHDALVPEFILDEKHYFLALVRLTVRTPMPVCVLDKKCPDNSDYECIP